VPTTACVVGACAAAAAGLAGYYAVRATSWAVMTDELQVARLATSIGERLSPVPYLHGVYYGALSQLYPALIAPFYGSMGAPSAETAAHVLNAVLLTSAAWPAFLLARSITSSRNAGYVAAALTVFMPWLVLSSTLLTENAAYPAFVWTLFLCQRTLASPSSGRDVGALAGLLLAFFARTQLLVLAAALPIALLLHELGIGLARDGTVSRGLRRVFREHRVLVVVYCIGAVGAGALAVAGSLGNVVGNYSTPLSGDLLPRGVWEAAAAHLVQVVVGAGILPFVLAVSWAAAALVHPERKEGHAFASLFVVLVPLLTVEVASFDLRFTPHRFIQDRYLFYLVPLFAAGTAAWLTQRTQRALRLVTLAATAAVLVCLLGLAEYDDRMIIFWASPAAAFHPALGSAADTLGLSSTMFLRALTVVAVVVVAAATWRVPRAATVGAAVAVAAFGAFEAGYVFERHADRVMTRPPAGAGRDWIDAAVPRGRSVALVPSPRDSPVYWWEAEFWNRSVDRVLRVNSGPTFTPFPADDVTVDYANGTLRGKQPADYLVVSPAETRFHIRADAHIADGKPLQLVRVKRPYRLAWATRGVTADGWTRPHQQATIRFYANSESRRRTFVLTLAASRFSPKPLGFVLQTRHQEFRGGVDPGGARPPVALSACVRAGSHVDVALTTTGQVKIPGGRVVALHLERIDVVDGAPCAGAQVSSR
jgi:hypothetical protein